MKVVTEGLFYHPGKDSVLERMVDGTVNPRLDDPFGPAIVEAAVERDRIKEQIRTAERRLLVLQGELKRAEAKLVAQAEARDHYAETGEIDPILVPSCEALAKAEIAEQDKKAKEDIAFNMPTELADDGWSKKSIRVTEDEIIVTIRKVRTDTRTTVEDEAEAMAEKVKIAMMPFQVDDAHYRRVLRDRIAARPQQPKGPPDG